MPEKPAQLVRRTEHQARYKFLTGLQTGPSEKTRVQTEGGVTILSNSKRAKGASLARTLPTPARTEPSAVPAQPKVEQVRLPSVTGETQHPQRTAARRQPSRREKSKWLLVLAGAAVLLLAPIGYLLARTTRSSG